MNKKESVTHTIHNENDMTTMRLRKTATPNDNANNDVARLEDLK